MNKNTCCQICVKEFFKVSNLRRHIKKFHPESFEELPKKQFAFTCDVCGKNFSYIRNYRCHLKTHDPNPTSKKVLKKCPLCPVLSEKNELYVHFEEIHGIKLNTQVLRFEDTESFLQWKMNLENDTQRHFTRNYTQHTKHYEEVVLYVCQKSSQTFSKVNSLNQVGSSVTKRMQGFCPASIKMMRKENGLVFVNYLETHVGHPNDEEKDECNTLKIMKSMSLRHKKSNSLSKDMLVKSENVWKFHSQKKDEVYVITLANNDNECRPECSSMCKDCKVCIHKYSCSCRDSKIKRNMCEHIHLLCKIVNEDKHQQIHLQQSDSSMDITDLIVYDAPTNGDRGDGEKSPIIIHQIRSEIPIEEKNTILQEFSNILIRCNSPSFFQEIVSIIGDLKSRLEHVDILDTTQTSLMQ